MRFFGQSIFLLSAVCLVPAWLALAQTAEIPPKAGLSLKALHEALERVENTASGDTRAEKLLGELRKRVQQVKAKKSGAASAVATAAAPSPPAVVREPLPARFRALPGTDSDCPNVVLFILDTLRPDKLGCYGFKQPTSPALDRFAREGVMFQHVLAQSSWTRPSIGSLLTSRYPRELGIYVEAEQILPDESVTLAEVLKAQGYRTIGLTANPNINKIFNFHQGFDHYVDSDVLFFWMPMEGGKLERGVSPLPAATDLFNESLALIDATGNQGPYYLQFNLMEVHEWMSNRPGTNMLRREYGQMFAPKDHYVKYLQLIRQLTDDLGDFVERLRALPGWEDTVFVFTSDHGEGMGDHRLVDRATTHGYILYESVVKVPWIIYRPGWEPARKVIQQEVRLLDLVPTVLDMVAAAVPEGVQGVSLLPVIDGTARIADLPRYHVVESEFGGLEKIALYGKRFKYIENRVTHPGLPPRELQPRGGRENGATTNYILKRPEVAAGMQQYLEEWELDFPKQPPVAPHRQLTPQEVEQLQNIGYL